jgi:hypothetical protein
MGKNEVFVDKKRFSKITIEGEMGKEIIYHDSTRVTLIIWFHPKCEHCRYQLHVINSNINAFRDVRLLFITDEKTFFLKKYTTEWPVLVKSSHTVFGIIDKSRFIDEYGPVITPTLLLFNKNGLLKEKLLGEVKIEKILQLLNKHSIPEHLISGSN